MNWKLIFALSLFGLGMAFATVYFIPSNIEPFCWLAIFFISSCLVAKYAPGNYFLHGFLTSLVNCIWITGAHILLSDTYMAHHANEAAQYAKMNKDLGLTVTQAMLIFGPIIGIISGIILGLFCLLASKIFKR
ncbi:MAG: hypothetical protein ACHQD8_02465 [Chitinophagales bacterium]